MNRILRRLSLGFMAWLFAVVCVSAQPGSEPEEERDFRHGVHFFGGIGPAIPVGDFGDDRETGFDLNTAISYRFPSQWLVRGMFDFSSFGFEPGAITQTVGEEEYQIGGSNNLISLLLSGGYYIPLGKRVTPYAFA